MNTVNITSVSSKGQIVIPADIREQIGLSSGMKLAVFTDGMNLLLKPIKAPKMEIFENLIKTSRQFARKIALKKTDPSKSIKKVRHESRS